MTNLFVTRNEGLNTILQTLPADEINILPKAFQLVSNFNSTYLYAYKILSNEIEKSVNNGQSWTSTTITSQFYPAYCINCNTTGQYVVVTGSIITTTTVYKTYISLNYGESYVDTGLTIQGRWFAFTDNGQSVYGVGSTGQVYYSNSYGASGTWNVFTNSPSQSNWSLCCSSTGQYIFVATLDSGVIFTKNYFTTWSYLFGPDAVYSISCSSSGQYFIASWSVGVSNLVYVSNDYCQTFKEINPLSTNSYSSIVTCSPSGQYMSYSSLNGYFLSSDYGKSFFLFTTDLSTLTSNSSSNFNLYYSNNGVYNCKFLSGTQNVNYIDVPLNNQDISQIYSPPFGLVGSSSYNYTYAATTYFNSLINLTNSDVNKLFSPVYNIYTTGTSVSASTNTWCTGIFVVLIGGGGGGGSGGASSSGTGGGGGAGGGGALRAVYIENLSPGTAMSYTFTVGLGGNGGAQRSSNGAGNTGSNGSASTFIYNSITYTANGGSGGLGGSTSNTGGNGGAGGTISGSLFNFSYAGNSGTNGMTKASGDYNAVMGGVGGFNGNYNVKYTVPAPASTVPTPTITYQIISEYMLNPLQINAFSSTAILPQNGSGQHNAPTVNYYAYIGQGGYGGNSDTNVGGNFGYAGSAGRNGTVMVCQYYGPKP